jgi:NTP pyrophosphatase (non-canonical NTP hydrolase)
MIKEYVAFTETTMADLGDQNLNNIHMTMGMITEVGELVDTFKKHIAYKKDIDWINVQEEIGDLMFYIAGFCRINNLNLEDILKANIAKLQTRYPDKFDADKATNRNLVAERTILEELGK